VTLARVTAAVVRTSLPGGHYSVDHRFKESLVESKRGSPRHQGEKRMKYCPRYGLAILIASRMSAAAERTSPLAPPKADE